MSWQTLPRLFLQGPEGHPALGVAHARATVCQPRALGRAQHRRRHLHAFPAADHPVSNAVCRKADVTLLGETGIECPPGCIMRCDDWQLEL